MKSMVVLFALCAVACGSYAPLAQPPHLPAIVLDARGRPLDTAEVINSRALHLQAKALEGNYGYGLHAGIAAPVLAHAGLGYGGHYLHKRSLGHYAHAAPAAVSHQSRVDVISSHAPVAHAVPVVAHAAPVVAHAAPIVAHAAPAAAVSHQSRVDVISSPAVVSHGVAAHGVAAPLLAHAAPSIALGHHGGLTKINHAAVAPIGYGAPLYSAPLDLAW